VNIFPFLAAYILTNLVELFPVSFLIKKSLRTKLPALLVINALSLPIIWLILPSFFGHYLLAFLVLEMVIIFVETALIHIFLGQTLVHSFKISIIANVLSAGIGFFLFPAEGAFFFFK